MIMLRKLLLVVFMVVALASTHLVSTVRAIPAVKEFDSPSEFPTGLTWDGEYLWVADFISERIYKVDPDDGSVIESFSSPDSDPEGLAWDGNYIWHVDGGNAYELGEEAELYIYKIDPQSGDSTKMFEAPGGNAEDLAWDGGYLWYVDGAPEAETEGTNRIYKIDVSNGEVVKEFSAPGNHPSGITWDGLYLWLSDYWNEEIYVINPDNGEVIDSFDTPSSYPGGLAWDGSYLWCADWDSGKIYSMDVSSFPSDNIAPDIDVPSRTPGDNVTIGEEVSVSVNVTDMQSGIKNVTLLYVVNNGTLWTSIPMNENSSTGLYESTIPGQAYGTWVKYKIVAYDNAENQAVKEGESVIYIYQVIPEFPSAIILLLFTFATSMATVLLKNKRRLKSKLLSR